MRLYLSTCVPRERGLSTVPVPQMTHQQHCKIQESELWLEGNTPQTRHLYRGPWYLLSSQGTPEGTYKRARSLDPCFSVWVRPSNTRREAFTREPEGASVSDPSSGQPRQAKSLPRSDPSSGQPRQAKSLPRSDPSSGQPRQAKSLHRAKTSRS